MASVASPSSPGSLQLRFGQWSAKPSPVIFRIRFRPSTRRRILLVSANGGDGQSQDSFAGWYGSEGGDGGGDPKKNKDRFGGMLGAGLAGLFFTAGITFASLSLSSKATSGVKQQLEPLTTEQEVILTSDDQIEKVDQIGNEASVMLPDEQRKIDDCNSGFQKGINKDLSHMETVEDSKGSDLDNIHHSETSLIENTKSNGNDVDANHKTSKQDDMQIAQDVDESPVPSTSSPTSPEFSSNDDVEYSSDAYSFKDSHNAVNSVSLDSAIEQDPNQSSTNRVDIFSVSADSTIPTNDHQEGNLTHVDMPLDISSEFESQPQSEPSASTHVMLGSGDIVDSPDSSSERVNTAAVVLEKEDIENSEVLQLLAEASSLNPAVHDPKTVPFSTSSGPDLDQNVSLALPMESVSSTEGYILENNPPSVAYSGVVSADPSGNKPDIISSHSQVGKSLLFESVLSEKPISYAGIPAPSLVSAALQVPPGKVLVPAVVDQVQGQALTALQVLKVVEGDVQPGDLCTRREYARWLVSASSVLSRNTISKVYPAMYIENVTELAFDDVTPEDPDYSCIQGLAEAGIISSKLSKSDMDGTSSGHQNSFFFSPERPVSRQDLVSWKMALERRQLPEVDRNYLFQCSGYIDIDKIDKDAWPALVADLSAGEQGITALAFGFTRLFQPNKPVTKAQAAIALATGDSAEVVGEELTRIEAESLAETAVNAHTALVAQVEKELNASFEAELAREREKINLLEKLAEEARLELERLKAERAEENNNLVRGQVAVESEMEVLSRLRHEVEEQLQDLMSNKMEISFERDRINKLRKEAESQNQVIVQLHYELEVERKALSMARAWAEEEAKRAREQARVLEEARDRWEGHGIKVVVDENLQEDASTGVTWLTAGQQPQVDETVNRGENLVEKLKAMAAEIKIKSSTVIERIIQRILSLITALKGLACKSFKRAIELQQNIVSKASTSIGELKDNASGFSSNISDKARRAVEDCKESVEKFSQKFKT